MLMGTVRHLLAESAGHDSPTPGELGKKPVGGVPRSPGSEGRSGLSRRFLERAGFGASGLLLQIKDLELLGGYWRVSLLLKDTMEWGPQALRLLSLPEAALESPSLTLWRGVPSSGLQGHGAGAGSERHGGECAPYFSVLFLGIPGQGNGEGVASASLGPKTSCCQRASDANGENASQNGSFSVVSEGWRHTTRMFSKCPKARKVFEGILSRSQYAWVQGQT